MLRPLVDSARADWASCLAFVNDGQPASSTAGLEGHVDAMLDAAWQLQQAFAQAQQHAQQQHAGSTVAQLRSEIEALRRQHREKAALIARHRERLQRWSAECREIQQLQQEALSLSLPEEGVPRDS